jgi:Fe-S cluster assembly protein SufD
MVSQSNSDVTWYSGSFERFEKSLNGSSGAPVHALRRKAFSYFTGQGFPTTSDEEWRFTSLSTLAKIPFAPVFREERTAVRSVDAARFFFQDLEGIRLVFVDGHFSPELSHAPGTSKGIFTGGLASMITSRDRTVADYLGRFAGIEMDPLAALNTAFLQDGACIMVPDGLHLEHPVQILYLSGSRNEPFLTVPRNLIIVGKGSHLSLVETYAGSEGNRYFTNAVTEILVGPNAIVEHDKLQVESESAFHIGTSVIHQHEGSTYTANSISVGGSLVRNTVTAVLSGEHCECTLNGLSLATGEQLVDNHTAIDHAKPNCVSHELYKSILDGRARGVFNGKIFVRKDAQKTDAKQTNKTLLLSDDATIDTKPQLEIFADDVKCTHGATVGQIDEDQVFYLRSRGIGIEQARDVLTYAFAADVISRVHIDPLRDQLEGVIHARLQKGRVTSG